MASLLEIPIIDAASQDMTLSLNGKRCRLRLDYNTRADRWSFALWVNDVLVLSGRRIVTGCDLVGAFDFGVGQIVAASWDNGATDPDRRNLPSGRVRLFSIA
jgi:hypothetical protein